MKLHYKGKYNLNPDSLPHNEHKPNAKPFKEAENTKTMSIIANIGSLLVSVLLVILGYFRWKEYLGDWRLMAGCWASFLVAFPHELLHALCFRNDVYLYTNWQHGMLFLVGTETMSKGRFIFMSLLPNIVFGLIPYMLGMILPQSAFLIAFGTLALAMGFGDYYNVFNAVTQMPKGARTYLYKFNSFWYIPE